MSQEKLKRSHEGRVHLTRAIVWFGIMKDRRCDATVYLRTMTSGFPGFRDLQDVSVERAKIS